MTKVGDAAINGVGVIAAGGSVTKTVSVAGKIAGAG